MATFWFNGANLVVNVSNEPIDCVTCPCAPPVCGDCITTWPSTLYLTMTHVSGDCTHHDLASITLTEISGTWNGAVAQPAGDPPGSCTEYYRLAVFVRCLGDSYDMRFCCMDPISDPTVIGNCLNNYPDFEFFTVQCDPVLITGRMTFNESGANCCQCTGVYDFTISE